MLLWRAKVICYKYKVVMSKKNKKNVEMVNDKRSQVRKLVKNQ